MQVSIGVMTISNRFLRARSFMGINGKLSYSMSTSTIAAKCKHAVSH